MATKNVPPAAPAAVHSAAEEFPAFGTSTAGMLRGLFFRAQHNLSADDLQALACKATEAQNVVGHLEVMCNGIACLVAGDADRPGESIGNFQDGEELASLLWGLGNLAGYAVALMNLSEWANSHIDYPKGATV